MTAHRPSGLDQVLFIIAHLWILSLVFSVHLAEALAILLIILWLPTLRRRPRPWTNLDLPVIVFLVIRLSSIGLSVDPATSADSLREIALILVFFPLSRIAWQNGSKGIASLLLVAVVAGLVLTVHGLASLYLFDGHRLTFVAGRPGTAAAFLAAAFVIGVALSIGDVLRPALVWGLGLVCMLWALAYTYVRTPWFIAVITGLVLVSRWRRWVTAIVVIAAVIMLTVPGFRLQDVEILRWPPNIGDRQVLWQEGWKLIDRRPIIGYGPGTFGLLFHHADQLANPDVDSWSSYPLDLWVESGLFGLLAFAWIVIEAVQAGRPARRKLEDPFARPTATALLAAVTVLLAAGLFGELIGDPVIELLLWCQVALLASFTASHPMVASPPSSGTVDADSAPQ